MSCSSKTPFYEPFCGKNELEFLNIKNKINMKNNKSTNPTVSIKCEFANEVHKILEPNINVKNSDRWKFRDKYKFTDAQKLEMFDKIMELHTLCSTNLTNYQYDKRNKKRIHAARVARGYKFKTKTKKEDWLKHCAQTEQDIREHLENNLQKVA